MNTERLRLVESLFWEAIDLDERQLSELLLNRCSEDHSLRQTVIALLERDRAIEGANFLEPCNQPSRTLAMETVKNST